MKKNLKVDAFPKVGSGPWQNNYVWDINDSPELEPKRASHHQSLVGFLHWMVELGRVNIITETSILVSHLAMPQEGHLDAALHVFGYLKWKHNLQMVFNPRYPKIDRAQFIRQDWTLFYGDEKEAKPKNCLKLLGKPVDLRMMVNANWASNKARQRSLTGYFIFLNSAPIAWQLQ